MGKTSIIEVLITEQFQENVQPVLPVLVVPKEVTPEQVHVSIVDTPGKQDEIAKVESEVRQADVVVIVYAVDNKESVQRVTTYWLHKFRSMKLNIPIILAGNKIDSRGGVADPEAAAKMELFIKPIMDTYREVDVCIECSAKTVSNISEVFYFAQKAVLYPTGPVYNVETHELRPRAVSALRRIFKLCDKDGDGGLNDKELNEFQYACFRLNLQPAELEGVKKVVKENRPQNGINADGSLSVEGFIFLHTLFVQKGRLETTWIVLRKFGYDDDMRIRLDDADVPSVAADQSVELSADGRAFLEGVFARADTDGDGLLAPEEVSALFENSDAGVFESTAGDGRGERLTRLCSQAGRREWMSRDAFMARWHMVLMDNLEGGLQALLALGYAGVVATSVRVTRSRRRDRAAGVVSRGVLTVGVVGGTVGMRGDLVRGLIGGHGTGGDGADVMAAGRVEGAAEEKLLVVRSVDDGGIDGVMLEKLDVVAIVFDAGRQESLEGALAGWQAVEEVRGKTRVPVVFVAVVGAEGDGGSVEGVLSMADEFCLEQGVPTASRVSIVDGEFGKLYEDLLGVGLYPQVACPDYYDGGGEWDVGGAVVRGAVGLALCCGLVYVGRRVYDYWTGGKISCSA